jgi:hypothetical protein
MDADALEYVHEAARKDEHRGVDRSRGLRRTANRSAPASIHRPVEDPVLPSDRNQADLAQ